MRAKTQNGLAASIVALLAGGLRCGAANRWVDCRARILRHL